MKVCVAQTKPAKGNIHANIANHKKLINLAVSEEAEIIIFPELSLTGYEPKLAKELAIDLNDGRLDDFQKISDKENITIGLGAPLRNNRGICISLVIFQPNKPRSVYSKKYLHPDEDEYFVSGENLPGLTIKESKISLAICYELSIPQHSENAHRHGSEIYIASVAKSTNGIGKALESLAGIAGKYSMMVLMSNCIGTCDGEECAGKTSAWDTTGQLKGQLQPASEGILILDTEKLEVRIIEDKKAE